MRTLILLVALVSAAGCTKGKSLADIQKDGYGCTKQGGGAAFVPKPGEHCFQCPDDASLQKCGENPLTSGCKEVDIASCGK
jgi:hypothetical protein